MLAGLCILCDVSRLEYTEGSKQHIRVLHGKHSATSEKKATAFVGNFSVYACVLIRKTEISFTGFDACVTESKWREIFMSVISWWFPQ